MKGVSKFFVAFAVMEKASRYLYFLNTLGYASIIGLFWNIERGTICEGPMGCIGDSLVSFKGLLT